MPLTTTNRNVPLLVQGAYFTATGAWSLLHYPSFEAVTGKKTDAWLVRAVGVLATVIGAVIAYTTYRRRETHETYALSYGTALGLAALDTFYASRGTISKIYLLDALGETVLVSSIEYSRRSLGRNASRRIRRQLARFQHIPERLTRTRH